MTRIGTVAGPCELNKHISTPNFHVVTYDLFLKCTSHVCESNSFDTIERKFKATETTEYSKSQSPYLPLNVQDSPSMRYVTRLSCYSSANA